MTRKTIVVIGECMIELQRESTGLNYRFGGDTLNTAVYLARLLRHQPFNISYVSALGQDSLSDEMCASWTREGVLSHCVQRLPGKLPGLYWIETAEDGERRFHYWRGDSAARYWLQGPQARQVCTAITQASHIYLSGISLAILPPTDRERLLETLAECRRRGGRIVFDNNYRPTLWEGAAQAADMHERLLAQTDIALLTLDDEDALHGPIGGQTGASAAIARSRALGVAEIIIKRGADSCILATNARHIELMPEPVAQVVDTTAAGDAFAAGYLAARLNGELPQAAVHAGHRLAGVVIQHHGAIIPEPLMPHRMNVCLPD